MCTTPLFSQHDLAVLTRLVQARSDDPCAAVERLAHLTRSSRFLDGARASPPRVALGAGVRFRVAGSVTTDSVVIASPEDSLAMLERVPVLAPLALGLLGHAEGCTVELALALGRSVRLEIVEVRPPAGSARRAQDRA